LNEIQRFAHGFSSVTESTIYKLPSVSKGKMSHWRVRRRKVVTNGQL
jgi:hypothetical protein